MWVPRSVLAVGLLAFAVTAAAVSKTELETRIQQLERKLDSRSLMDLVEQLSALQREVQELRGEVEVQTHSMESVQKRQRDLYLDIDRRLHRLEAGGVQSQPALPSAAPAASATRDTAVAPVTSSAALGAAGPAAAGAAATAAVLDPAEQRKDYDRALEQLKEGRYTDAAAAFQAFLKKYPGSSYADNAQYWLGEVFYVTRKFQPALKEFDKVVNDYPDSSKIADAKLKMGYIQYEIKDWTKARDMLNQVVQGYPGTTTARLAQERLQRMKREGHLK